MTASIRPTYLLSLFYVFVKSQACRGSLLVKMAEISSYFSTKDSPEVYSIQPVGQSSTGLPVGIYRIELISESIIRRGQGISRLLIYVCNIHLFIKCGNRMLQEERVNIGG
jgi:hypothetical protein